MMATMISVGGSLAQGHWDVFCRGVSWDCSVRERKVRRVGSGVVWTDRCGGRRGVRWNGLITCGPRDLVSPRPWDSHPTLALAFTLNALGIVLGSVGLDICGSVSPMRVGEDIFDAAMYRSREWDLAWGTNRDSTPPQGAEPLRSRWLLVFGHTDAMTGGVGGPCMTTSTWVPPITVGRYRGRPTTIACSSSFPLPLCKLPSPMLSPTTSWPFRLISQRVQASFPAILSRR